MKNPSDNPVNLTGVEVTCDALFKLQPNMVLAVISDKDGLIRIIQIDHNSIPQDQSFLRVAPQKTPATKARKKTGCFVRTNGWLEWVDPCPY
jgi:hypothetical protein